MPMLIYVPILLRKRKSVDGHAIPRQLTPTDAVPSNSHRFQSFVPGRESYS